MIAATEHEFLQTLSDPPRGLLPVPRSNHAIHSLFNVVIGVQPTGTADKALRRLLWRSALIVPTEILAHEMMKARPCPSLIQWDQEEVAHSKRLQLLLGVLSADCLSKRHADSVEHG